MAEAKGWLARMAHRVGFRGTTLLLLAAVDFAYGRTFIDPDPSSAAVRSYFTDLIPFATQAVSVWVWACAWWVTGLVCLVTAFLHRDWLGYGMSFALYVAYVATILFAGAQGLPSATTRGIVWSFVAAWVFVEARRPEPQRDIGEVAREMEETGEIPKHPGAGGGAHA